LTTLLADLEDISALDAASCEACMRRAGWVRGVTRDEVLRLLDSLLERTKPADEPQKKLLAEVFRHVVARQRGAVEGIATLELDDRVLGRVADLAGRLEPASPARDLLLCLLTGARTRLSLAEFAHLIIDQPPADTGAVASIFGPLFQHKDYDASVLFPRLMEGVTLPGLAPMVLDLANFVTRCKMVDRHPGAGQQVRLAALLGELVGRLGSLESAVPDDSKRLEEVSQQIAEGVSIAVSLCDALALIGDRSVVGKLYQASELGHRRLRTEAVAALARLGEEAGAEALVALAAEPIVRLRVLAYAEELGCLDRVDQRYQTGAARAEAELALWLAQPSQMAVPPNSCELIDQRTQYWPGYDEPVDCYLLRFVYLIGDAEFSNIGIAGPTTHAFAADLCDLPPDDIYAAFAGWQAEHDEIRENAIEDLGGRQHGDVSRLQRVLADRGYEAVEPQMWGQFFGALVLVARARYGGQPGIAVADDQRTCWWPQGAGRRPIGSQEAYCIYKGRKLLQAFND
jgi:hypothetical protein